MLRETSSLTSQELNDRGENLAEDMREHIQDVERVAEDIKAIRGLLESLDLDSGTADTAAQVETSVEAADTAASEEFDRTDAEFEEVDKENEEHQSELLDRSDASERNLGVVSDVTAPVETWEAVTELREAKEALVESAETLREMAERAREVHEENQRIREALHQVRQNK